MEHEGSRDHDDGTEHRDRLFRALVENAKDIPYIASLDGTLTFLGQQIARYGHDPEEVRQRGVFAYILEEDLERVLADLQRSQAEGTECATAFRIRTADGEICWLEDESRVLRDEQGTPIGLCGALRDITLRKRTEEALQASELRMRRFAENSFDALVELDAAGRLLYASPALERISGGKVADLLGQSFLDHVSEEQQQQAAEALGRLLAGEVVEGLRLTFRRLDGDLVHVEVNATPTREGGQTVGVLGIVRDVSQRLELEAHMLQMQKLEAIGTLAGGVAHDFNNLLTGILGYANLIQVISPDESDVYRGAEVIEQAASRAAELTRQLLGFARQGKVQNIPVDMHGAVRGVIALLARTVDRRVELICRLEAERAVVQGDPAQLEQVLLNLAINAADAMPRGGELRIASRSERLPLDGGAPVASRLQPGRYVVLSVSDTGVGIPADVQRRIFEPFFTTFTTKPQGAGSGLGLAMVYGIVRNHGGQVTVSSSEGRGATFQVWLPVVDAPEVRSAAPEAAALAQGRILIVDDESVVCLTASRMLESLDYGVEVVHSGEEALERLAQQPAIDLVLLDMVMPGMGGLACLQRIRERWPQLPVLISSGHAIEHDDPALVDHERVAHLQKPYVRAQLATAVVGLLRQ